jgi:uncharacterized membrane protein
MEILDPDTGLQVLIRALHVLAGIAWIGLLYYFNLVQVPSFAAYGDEARARNVSIDQLARRALWWFRWAAIVTLVLGLLLIAVIPEYMQGFMSTDLENRDGVAHDAAIFVGMVFGILMAANVWMVIWKNQKVVLANAANVLAGGEADPAAAAAGRKALLASRTNFILSFSMLWFMVGAAHLYSGGDSAGAAWAYVIIACVLAGVFELLGLGKIGGTAATNKMLWPFESHKNALITGGVLFLFLFFLSEFMLLA